MGVAAADVSSAALAYYLTLVDAQPLGLTRLMEVLVSVAAAAAVAAAAETALMPPAAEAT